VPLSEPQTLIHPILQISNPPYPSSHIQRHEIFWILLGFSIFQTFSKVVRDIKRYRHANQTIFVLLARLRISLSLKFITTCTMEEVVRLIASRDFPAAIEVAVANDLVDAVDEIHRANPKILDRIFWAGLKRVRPRIVEQAIRLGFLTVGRTTAKHNAIFGAIKHPAMLSLLLQHGFPVDAYATIRTHTTSLHHHIPCADSRHIV